jgi:hypothetical protein
MKGGKQDFASEFGQFGWGAYPKDEPDQDELNFKKWRDIVSNVFIQAVIDCDKERILQLAEAAAFFKDKLGDGFPPADPVRHKLLQIKYRPSIMQTAFTIRQLAEMVYPQKRVKQLAGDGFSALRRICKEMGIRIKPSRKIRRK